MTQKYINIFKKIIFYYIFTEHLKIKYSLYCIDKQINKQTIKYNNWQENADWVTGAIEINPNIIRKCNLNLFLLILF